MEIGGFFEYPEHNEYFNFQESVFHVLTSVNWQYTFFGDGRQSIKAFLQHLLSTQNLSEIYLPAYLCESITQPFDELKLKYTFYNLVAPLRPQLPSGVKNSLIFLIDYFGVESFSNDNIIKLLNQNNYIILDLSHGLFNLNRFSINHKNLTIISSLRKLFPIPDGGILYSRHNDYNFSQSPYSVDDEKKFIESMKNKARYLRSESKNKPMETKKSFLARYQEFENTKDNTNIIIQHTPKTSLSILKKISFDEIYTQRVKNCQRLFKIINVENLLFKIRSKNPLAYFPLIFNSEEERDIAKKILIDEQIYPPIHWNLPPQVSEDFIYESELSKRILSIPIDQRYTTTDMNRIGKILTNIGKK